MRTFGDLESVAVAITTACDAAAVGLDVCARRTSDELTFVAAKSAAAFLRELSAATVEAAEARGVSVRPRSRTCDRLRWEWLASTATIVDGSPDARLLAECVRLLSEVDADIARELGGEIEARFHVASAEAYSLASAIGYANRQEITRRGELALAVL